MFQFQVIWVIAGTCVPAVGAGGFNKVVCDKADGADIPHALYDHTNLVYAVLQASPVSVFVVFVPISVAVE